MSILDGFKTCRKGLHHYSVEKRQCPFCLNNAKRKWDKKNQVKCKQAVKNWRDNNRFYQREYSKQWSKLNAGRKNANRTRYKNTKKKAVPLWANHEKIKSIYEKADILTKETGIAHHVDHIYPLQSKYMCGLHVETNLQILTAEENMRKGNRTWPGQLDCQKD
jgi:hypothetical protein